VSVQLDLLKWSRAIAFQFLQHVSIACYAERCTSYSKSVRLSVTRWYCVDMTQATIMGSSLQDIAS